MTHRGKQEYELTKKRRAGFLAAISREGLEDSRVLEDNRICSRHFISGKPAYLYDEANPDWLPTLHLGHLHYILAMQRRDPNQARILLKDGRETRRGEKLQKKWR